MESPQPIYDNFEIMTIPPIASTSMELESSVIVNETITPEPLTPVSLIEIEESNLPTDLLDSLERRRLFRKQKIDILLHEFEYLDAMIDGAATYVSLCQKYEQIYSLWVYAYPHFNPFELNLQEAKTWRLIPAILLCYKHFLIRKRENMDLQNFDMDDRLEEGRTLRSIPKRGDNDIVKLVKIFDRAMNIIGMYSTKSIEPPLKKEKKLREFTVKELRQEWKELIKNLRTVRDAWAAGEETEIHSTRERRGWKCEFRRLRRKVEASSVLDLDLNIKKKCKK
ncbi:hypothetical protein G9A89_002499 [Geosiphon pyriformis]|nr:hypothetical protein G9A89_002499 [Geosiphon pyriformis]